MYLVRKATMQDREAIVALMVEMHLDTYYSKLKPNPQKTYNGLGYYIEAEDTLATLLIAEKEGEIVGCVGGGVSDHWGTDSTFAHQDLFTVAIAHKRNGVGGQLFTAFFNWAKKHTDHIHTCTYSGKGGSLDSICESLGMTRAGSAYVWCSTD